MTPATWVVAVILITSQAVHPVTWQVSKRMYHNLRVKILLVSSKCRTINLISTQVRIIRKTTWCARVSNLIMAWTVCSNCSNNNNTSNQWVTLVSNKTWMTIVVCWINQLISQSISNNNRKLLCNRWTQWIPTINSRSNLNHLQVRYPIYY